MDDETPSIFAPEREIIPFYGATCATCGFRYAEHKGHIIPCPVCAAAGLQARVEAYAKINSDLGSSLRAGQDELAGLRARVRELEATRDKLVDSIHDFYMPKLFRAEQTVGRLRGRLMAIEQLRIAAAPDSPQVRLWIEVGAEVRAALSLLDAALSPQEPAA